MSHTRQVIVPRSPSGHVLETMPQGFGKTVVMVTNDMDEALYLADRLILMTDEPEATVGALQSRPSALDYLMHPSSVRSDCRGSV